MDGLMLLLPTYSQLKQKIDESVNGSQLLLSVRHRYVVSVIKIVCSVIVMRFIVCDTKVLSYCDQGKVCVISEHR